MHSAAKNLRGAAVVRAPIWQSAVAQCCLCAGRRRDYLFVIGQARMTRCHDCGLISKTDGSSHGADGGPGGHPLDPEADRSIRDGLAGQRRLRLLQVLVGGLGGLAADDRFDVVTLSLPADAEKLDRLEPHSFDAAFVNGPVEEVRDPVIFLQRVRAALRFGAALSVVADAGDPHRIPSDEALPRHVFQAPTLLRLALAAGLRPERCGFLPGAPSRFRRLHGLLRALGGNPAAECELLELRALVSDAPKRPRVSIIMPVFNEVRTFRETFERVAAWSMDGLDREIVVVESNSTDGSRQLVQSVETEPGVRVIYEDRPRGKGHAVRAGLAAATGEIILIQDADSEYDVSDYDIVLEPLLHLSATFVLGSRHMGGRTWKIRQFAAFKALSLLMNLAHEFFTALANFLYGAEMRDPTTMYKVFRRECIQGIAFRRNRFDFDWELVCKLIRRGHAPLEVPINYRSRSYAEGKKVGFFRDPLTWLVTIVSSRFERLQ